MAEQSDEEPTGPKGLALQWDELDDDDEEEDDKQQQQQPQLQPGMLTPGQSVGASSSFGGASSSRGRVPVVVKPPNRQGTSTSTPTAIAPASAPIAPATATAASSAAATTADDGGLYDPDAWEYLEGLAAAGVGGQREAAGLSAIDEDDVAGGGGGGEGKRRRALDEEGSEEEDEDASQWMKDWNQWDWDGDGDIMRGVSSHNKDGAAAEALASARLKASKFGVSVTRYSEPKTRLAQVVQMLSGNSMIGSTVYDSWLVGERQWLSIVRFPFLGNMKFGPVSPPTLDKKSAERATAVVALAELMPHSDFAAVAASGSAAVPCSKHDKEAGFSTRWYPGAGSGDKAFSIEALYPEPKEPSPGAELDGSNKSAAAKVALNEAAMRLSKCPLWDNAVVYETLEVKGGGYQTSVRMICLPGELGEQEWVGKVTFKRRDAEISAAAAALAKVMSVPELFAVVTAPKRVKLPWHLRDHSADAGVVNFQARESGLKVYVEGSGRRDRREAKRFWTIDITPITTLSSVRSMIRSKRIPAPREWLFAHGSDIIEMKEESKLKANDYLPSLTLVHEDPKKRRRTRRKGMPAEYGPQGRPKSRSRSRSRGRDDSRSRSGSDSRSDSDSDSGSPAPGETTGGKGGGKGRGLRGKGGKGGKGKGKGSGKRQGKRGGKGGDKKDKKEGSGEGSKAPGEGGGEGSKPSGEGGGGKRPRGEGGKGRSNRGKGDSRRIGGGKSNGRKGSGPKR